ncbi:MAG TPA: hypothetical protein VEU96_08225 [Bryobacteraceae bacterium]|nr:hypothetical protein [Bryobacteraceae bacterium]
MSANAFNVTTALMVAFAAFVAYIRLKNWLDSNVPIFFYVIMLGYAKYFYGLNKVPVTLILIGFGLTLLLRFEFMSQFFINLVKVLEYAALAVIIYFAVASILA